MRYHNGRRRLSCLLVLTLLLTGLPVDMLRSEAETSYTLLSDPLQVLSDTFTVRFFHRNENGEQELYQEEGFANPQTVTAGEMPVSPAGMPDAYPGFQFTGWDTSASQPVKGATDIYALYAPLKTVMNIVEFVRDNGSYVGGSYYALVKEGDSLKTSVSVLVMEGMVPSEESAVDGFSFLPDGSGGGTVEINIEHASTDQVYRIVYASVGEVKYTVDHYIEGTDGKYTLKNSSTQSGVAGSVVRPTATPIEGYTLATDLSALTDRIAADESTHIRLEYKRNQYSVYYDPGVMGTMPQGQSDRRLVYFGDAIDTNIGTPTRSGYTFAEWKVEEDLTLMPARDIMVTAEWKPDMADYLVVVWGEDIEKDDQTGKYAYSVLDNDTQSGSTGEAATFTPKEYSYFTYDHMDQDVKIKADGSTILNVYYKRNDYTLTFRRYGTTILTIKARFQADIRDYYNTPAFSSYMDAMWNVPGGKSVKPLQMPGENMTYEYTERDSNVTYTVRHMLQPLGSDGEPVKDHSAYTLLSEVKYYIKSTGGQHRLSRYAQNGYEAELPPGKTKWEEDNTVMVDREYMGPNQSENTFYYMLKLYPITYSDRGKTYKTNAYYTQKLDNYGDRPEISSPVAGYEDFTFEGWYETQDFSGDPFVFENHPMPPHGLVLYAKWAPPTYTITFDSVGGTEVPAQQIGKWSYATEPADPTRAGHDFQGWYLDSAYAMRFLFSQPIQQALTLYAKWSGDNTIPVTIQHLDESGNPLTADTQDSGTKGQTITVHPEDITGYLPTERSKDVQLMNPAGETVVFRYVPMHAISYTVHYKDAADQSTDLRPPKTIDLDPSHPTAIVTATREVIPGYTPDELQKTLHIIHPSPNDIIFYYTRNSSRTTYTVVTHIENPQEGGFTAQTPVTKEADLGARVEETPAPPAGYVFDADMSTVSGNALTDGKLRLDLYYRCQTFSYDVAHVNGKTGEVIESATREKIRYGQQVKETALDRDDLRLLSYGGSGVGTGTGKEVSFTVTAEGIRLQFDYVKLYTLTASAEGGGSITPEGATIVDAGTDKTFTYKPEEGFVFDALLVDGAPLTDADKNTYTFTDINADHIITVRFVAEQNALTIAAIDQEFVYNGKPQGTFGQNLTSGLDKLVKTTGLQSGHTLRQVSIPGTQRQDADIYTDVLVPEGAQIVDSSGKDVTSRYTIAYQSGTLTIYKKGNGEEEPGGGEKPLVITATPQTYRYTGQPQGFFGTNVAAVQEQTALATAVQLAEGHSLKTITLTGEKKTDPKTYPGHIVPSAAIIVDAGGADVTGNYNITTNSYHPADLIILPYDGTANVVIRAANQSYVYTGQPQGMTGNLNIDPANPNPLVTATGLLMGHRLASVTLDGQPQTEVGEYEDSLMPRDAVILDTSGNDVTLYYQLTKSNYKPGTLIIKKVGGEGLRIIASDQHFTYNEKAQGTFGPDLAIDAAAPLAKAEGLMAGHILKAVTLAGDQQVEPGTYGETIVPTGAKIVDTDGRDVTNVYNLTANTFTAGDLVIHKKGNGDKDDENGGEEPLDIIAKGQEYTYNGKPQGKFGAHLPVKDPDLGTLATAIGLLEGHALASVSLLGAPQEVPDVYTDAITPLHVKIVDGAGKDVTDKYLITEGVSYHPGTLTIHPKGNGIPDDKNGGELPVEITAEKQTYIYNGQPQGRFGDNLANPAATPLVTVKALVAGHRVEKVWLDGMQQTDPDAYKEAIAPTQIRIVDGAGEDVTTYYRIEDTSYHKGDLIIYPKGNGTPDEENGGELPLDITAEDQSYIYNGKPQGKIGDDLPNTDDPTLAKAVGLLSGHTITTVSMKGTPQMDAGRYDDTLLPTRVIILDGQGKDVTDKYRIEQGGYHPGDLIIYPKGNGTPDEKNGGEMPLDITAADQRYVYNKTPQGLFGKGLEIKKSAIPLVEPAVKLVDGHTLVTITLTGNQEMVPGTYAGSILPGDAVIHDKDGKDVTANYRIEDSSYHTGDLTIYKKGNGTPDEENGGELPLDVTAGNQSYVYNGQGQGRFGQRLTVDPEAKDPLAAAHGLLAGDKLSAVSLLGTRMTNPGVYPDAIHPLQARIVDDQGKDVTAYYRLEEPGYHAGTLTIYPKGNGIPDEENGGELPLDITAETQRYVYNGQPQGQIGTGLENNAARPLATAEQLVPGHHIQKISIAGDRQTLPNTYPGTLIPAEAVIVDASGADVTGYYRIEAGVSYHPGDLIITKKGNGVTDPDDPDGGELPLEIRALDQTFVYSGYAQGTFGDGLSVDAFAPVASALELAPGHTLSKVTISGQQQIDVGIYADTIIPSAAVIVDAQGNNVTAHYRIETGSYLPGTLDIKDAQGGTQVLITAMDQHYIYSGEAQGNFGSFTFAAGDPKPVARAQGLAFGHRLVEVKLDGMQQVEPKTYAGEIKPSGAKIVDGNGVDVTSQYALDADSYRAGNLVIHPKGNGTTDPNDPNAEAPLDIFAEDQSYIYNGKPQGEVGDDLKNTGDPALARAIGLLAGHGIQTVSLDGNPQSEVGRYVGALIPSKVIIVDDQGNDVTGKYRIEGNGMHAGDLIIYPKGNGTPDKKNGGELPMEITASDQEYIYNGQPQGKVGVSLPVGDAEPLAIAYQLVKGHSLKTITLLGTQKTDVGVYAGALAPMQAVIVDADGNEVTGNYHITGESYTAGTLTVHPKGNGQPDEENGGELPMDITAKKQTYVYSGKPQGLFGNDLPATQSRPLAEAVSLAMGHRMLSLTLTGDQQTEPGAYPGEIVPSGAVIVDGGGQDVTKNYRIEDASYHPGDLEILKKGNGTTDPDDPNHGELPLDVYAAAQRFIYNGAPQGTFGGDLNNAVDPPLATAVGLLEGHHISTVSLTGTRQTEVGRYDDAITPTKVIILDGQGADVTDRYRIEASSYHNGDLHIGKKGNGTPDPSDPDGGELPLDITASEQAYTYNAQKQGLFGSGLDVVQTDGKTLATAAGLAGGHTLSTVTLTGAQQSEAGTYSNAIQPEDVSIVDAGGNDVTKNYRIEDTGYHPGNLIIYPKGNGTPDPNGGEEPLDVTATEQRYVYNGQHQGVFGAGLAVQAVNGPLATAEALLKGHALSKITLTGMPQTLAGTYKDAIVPSQVRIVDAAGKDVTANYRLEDGSYHEGDLVIVPRGAGGSEDTPIQITATDQTYVYSGESQGRFGQNLTSTQAKPLAESVDLMSGHAIHTVALAGDTKAAAGKYDNAIMPSDAKIVDVAGVDVTASYLITAESYLPGTLTIYPKGNGVPDEINGGELPLDITARNQTFVFDGQPKGNIGENLSESDTNPLVEVAALVRGHRVSTFSIRGQRETQAGEYPNTLTPDNVKIVDGAGKDVTANYRIEEGSYHKGNLTILADGTAVQLIITAADQHYVYNKSAQGTFGSVTIDPQKPLATASGLLDGHRLTTVTLAGTPQTDPATYRAWIVPSSAVVLDEQGNDVTSRYTAVGIQYVAGDLIIHKKGNGTIDPDDPDGAELPLDVTATEQRYVYNGKGQGVFGANVKITANDPAPKATASGLLDGHRLEAVSLTGTQQTDAGSYEDAILPGRARIVDNAGNDVTDKYRLEESGYHPGNLIILPKGNGQPDDKGGELPVDIIAADQRYVYNGQPQGVFGENIAVDSKTPQATAAALVPGEQLDTITLTGSRQTEPDIYAGAIAPTMARIVNAVGEDVTQNYLITSESYHAGDLVITKKGNGTTDPEDPNDGELPLDIFTLDQSFIYNGKPQGNVGNGLAVTEKNPLVNTIGLLSGHSVKTVSVRGSMQTEVGTYGDTLLAADIVIVDEQGRNVTDKYRIEEGSYHPGDLIIEKKGNGTIDPDGGEKPLDIYAEEQGYVYNGQPQGRLGDNLSNTDDPSLATANGLLEGHAIQKVSLGGTQQREAGRYEEALTPTKVMIVDAQGADVTDQYRLEDISYHPGDLVIYPKGNGTPDEKNGGEMPLDITASRQTYIYNAKLQGLFEENIPIQGEHGPLAMAQALVKGHEVKTVSLTGTQQTEAGTYTGAILPTGVSIVDADGNDVTANYRIEDSSMHTGDLIIYPKGNGVPDDKNGGELPLDVMAMEQRYVYDGQKQGVFGARLEAQTEDGKRAAAEGLLKGHKLSTVTLVGMPQAKVGTYKDAIAPLQAHIQDADGNDVTKNYRLEDGGYHPGDLVIVHRGEGGSQDTPIQIMATDQTFIYSGAPQGKFGENLISTVKTPLAESNDLLPGHRIQIVTLTGEKKIPAGKYNDAITPSGARIVDAGGTDITDCYLITAGSYQSGTLTIYPKGNGNPDEENGGELPLDIIALDQTFVFNGEAQGTIGDDIMVSDTNPLVSVTALASGHRVSTVSILGDQQVRVGEYADALTPDRIKIIDGKGADVTGNYRIEMDSYHKGKLTIVKDMNAKPLVITAADQHYVYNESAQGTFGEINIASDDPLATAEGLLSGHRLAKVTLTGAQQTDPNTYTGAIVPSAAVILDQQNKDVTAAYLPAQIQYLAGDLVISKKGNGTVDPDDPNGAELPLDVTAMEQKYIYNGKAQGIFGLDITITKDAPEATATGLLTGHKLERVALTGTQQTDVGVYEDAILPGRARIVDAKGNDVTDKYRLEDVGYHAGDLTILPKGNGTQDPSDPDGGELPLDITASMQRYVFSGKPQGRFGDGLTVEGDTPFAIAQGLAPGQRLVTITLRGNQETDPGTYAKTIVPSAARIVDATGNDVTANYRIETESYKPGDLIIDRKGNGNPEPEDPDGGEAPLDILTSDQSYIYNGRPQGRIGSNLTIDPDNPLATAIGLVEGHRLKTVTIHGDQQTNAGTYDDALIGDAVRIVDGSGRDVTSKYRIEDSSYQPGDLIIHPKGNGQPDGKGGELPLEITAATQVFLYTGKPQGNIGKNLVSDPKKPLAMAQTLVAGHSIKAVTIAGDMQTEEGVYPDSLMPSEATIINESGADVTGNYLLTPQSYKAGTLIIRRSDKMYILTIYHLSEDGKNLKIPVTTSILVGESCSYNAESIVGYTAKKAVIYENGTLANNNAPVSQTNLKMPGADVAVVIYYTRNSKIATTPVPTKTPAPSVTPTPRPSGWTPPPGGIVPVPPTRSPGGGGSGTRPQTTPSPSPAPSPTGGAIDNIIDRELNESDIPMMGDLVKNNGDSAE